ncbi:MAG: hypothetical protein WCF90_03560 [Methanomicrobiales archaeon]
MDESAKTQFRWKFYRLTVQLNIIVMIVALSIIIFFIVNSPYTPPTILGMLILALLLSLDFLKQYKETKAWLYAQPDRCKEGEDINLNSTGQNYKSE